MFHSEQLQEKWAPLLNHEGLDSIKDNHKRAVTAVLLENQEKFLREQSAFQSGGMLTEQPNINTDPSGTGNAGFSGSGASPVAGFDPVLISLIRRSMPNLVAYDLAGVQPMSGPTGLIFAMRSKYKTQGGAETFYDEVDTSFSGQNEAFDFAGSNVGMGTTGQAGTNPGALNPSTTTTQAAYNVGQGMSTQNSEDLGSAGDNFNQMAFSIEKVTVTAKSRLKSLRKSTEKLLEQSIRLLSKVPWSTPQLLVNSTLTSTPTVVGLLRSSKDFFSKSREMRTQSHKELVAGRAM